MSLESNAKPLQDSAHREYASGFSAAAPTVEEIPAVSHLVQSDSVPGRQAPVGEFTDSRKLLNAS